MGGQAVRRVRHDALHFLLGLTHADPANRVARKIQLHQGFERLLPQVFKHAALHNAKQRVRVLKRCKRGHAAARPAFAEFHRGACLSLSGDVPGGVVRRAFVKLHDDVAVENRLDLHRDFRRQKQLVAVDGRRKLHAFFTDFAAFAIGAAQRPDLKAAAVGQYRFGPRLKAVQSAELFQHIQAGPHP